MTLLLFLEDFSSKFKVRIDEAVPPRCSLAGVPSPRRNLYIPIKLAAVPAIFSILWFFYKCKTINGRLLQVCFHGAVNVPLCGTGS